MGKRNKNIGRIKRYNHNFYRSGRSFWIKRILLAAALVGVVFVLGFVLAPAVLDWGTHLWYTAVQQPSPEQPDTPIESAQPDAQTPDAPVEPAETPTPTPAPAYAPGSMQVLRISALQTPEVIAKTAQSLKEQGVAYGIVPLKDESGYLYYNSAVPQAAASVAATVIDPAAVARELTAQGIRPVASIAAFKDPMADRGMSIRYAGMDYNWLDNKAEAGGKRWMNPYSEQAVQYIGDLIQEAKDMGFEIVLLSGVQFPRQESPKQDFGDTQGRDRAAQLQADIAAWEARFAGSVTLLYEVPYEVCITPSTTLGGSMPGALGMKNLVLRMPAAEGEQDPEASAVPVTQDEVLASLYAGGVERIALRSGIQGEVMPSPAAAQ